jgi:GT2 family glycosyltransferase
MNTQGMRQPPLTLASVFPLRDATFPRGRPVVVVPVFGQPQHFSRCLESLLRWTDPEVPIIVADDCSPGDDIAPVVEAARRGHGSGRELVHVVRSRNLGFVENVNEAIRDSADGDLVILNSDVVVGPEWLERLQRAAYSSSRVATATPMTNHGTICSIPYRNTGSSGLPQDWTIEAAARAIAGEVAATYPELPTAVGHCMYMRRDAIEMVGGFDGAFSPGYSEEVDFSQRCISMGLCHVLADDVFVEHAGNQSFGSTKAHELARAHHEEILRRFPAYDRHVTIECASQRSPLAAALLRASRVLRGWSVTIDARCLSDIVTGTQVHVLQVIRSLATVEGMSLRVLIPDNAPDRVAAALLSEGPVDVIREGAVLPGIPKSDVIHRPFQLAATARDLALLSRLGERMVITHQDLIAYHNPTYFNDPSDWFAYRQGIAETLGLVDYVVFFSRHAREDALSSGLVEAHRSDVVYIGVDHTRPPQEALEATGVPGDKPYLVCIGTDFSHKNRVFSLKVLQSLVEEQDWDGRLVFVGPHVLHGSSSGDEALFFLEHPELRERVLDLAAVSDDLRDAVVSASAGVIYPTTFEGFGLVPFEAADLGVPCYFASVTSIAETLDASLATLQPWDASLSAASIAPILSDQAAADWLVRGIREAGEKFRWARTAEGLLRAYAAALDLQPRPLRDLTVDAIVMRDQREYAQQAVALANHLPRDTVGPLFVVSRSRAFSAVYFAPIRVALWMQKIVRRRH